MGEVPRPRTPLFSTRPYIVGYSGYIPGLMFRYGKTFGKAAEESIALYIKQQAERRSREEVKRSKSLPRLKPKRTESQIIEEFYSKYGIDGRSNPSYPPLPGYTGYIPKLKPTDMGIGRTFSAAARRGLAHVSVAREQRGEALHGGRSSNGALPPPPPPPPPPPLLPLPPSSSSSSSSSCSCSTRNRRSSSTTAAPS